MCDILGYITHGMQQWHTPKNSNLDLLLRLSKKIYSGCIQQYRYACQLNTPRQLPLLNCTTIALIERRLNYYNAGNTAIIGNALLPMMEVELNVQRIVGITIQNDIIVGNQILLSKAQNHICSNCHADSLGTLPLTSIYALAY